MQRDNLRAKMMALDDNYGAKIASKILDDNWDVPPESRPSSSKIAKTKDGAPGGPSWIIPVPPTKSRQFCFFVVKVSFLYWPEASLSPAAQHRRWHSGELRAQSDSNRFRFHTCLIFAPFLKSISAYATR